MNEDKGLNGGWKKPLLFLSANLENVAVCVGAFTPFSQLLYEKCM